MRRSIIIYLGVVAGMLISAAVFTWMDNQKVVQRYHQHMEQPGEQDLEPCAVCGGTGELCSHLPILAIETGGQKIPGRPIAGETHRIGYETGDKGEEEILVSLSAVDQEGVWHHSDDTPSHVSRALFRMRGNTSRWFDKPSYHIELVVDDRSADGQLPMENPLPLLGMSSGSEWALHGPFLDKTLMRNYMCMNLSAEVMGYAPEVRFCEVVLDGQYQGLYVLMETVAVQQGRVTLTPYEDGDPVSSYLVCLDYDIASDRIVDNFSTYTYRLESNTNLQILYPGRRHQNQNVIDYVSTDFSEIEKSLFSSEVFEGSYKDHIDVDSFVDYYILQEFFCITDSFSGSTYFYRDVRGTLSAGPVWDYNNAFDNYAKTLPWNTFHLSQHGWFSRLLMDEAFVEKVIRRYRQLRSTLLSPERLTAYIAETESWLGSAIDRNFAVWGYSFDPDQLDERTRRSPYSYEELTIYDLNPSSYAEAKGQMQSFMIRRGQWMDDYIEALRQYCHASRNSQNMSE